MRVVNGIIFHKFASIDANTVLPTRFSLLAVDRAAEICANSMEELIEANKSHSEASIDVANMLCAEQVLLEEWLEAIDEESADTKINVIDSTELVERFKSFFNGNKSHLSPLKPFESSLTSLKRGIKTIDDDQLPLNFKLGGSKTQPKLSLDDLKSIVRYILTKN